MKTRIKGEAITITLVFLAFAGLLGGVVVHSENTPHDTDARTKQMLQAVPVK